MLYMWSTLVILLLYATNGKTQTLGIFEGSGGDSGPTRAERFVESDTDEVIVTNSSRSCVEKGFRGTGFKLKGISYPSMFICPNGQIKFKDGFYQNYPYNYGTRPEQRNDPSVSPYWGRVDLLAFRSGESKVRFASYHNNTNRRDVVFNKVNQDVRGFTGRSDFDAKWVSVVTYEDIRPHDRTRRQYEGKNTFQAVFVSDDTSWYLIYNYADIDWAVGVPRNQYNNFVGRPGLPVAGWNAGITSGFNYRNGEDYQNLPLSGTVNAEDLDDLQGNLGQGRWIFTTSTLEDKSPDLLCQEWSSSTIRRQNTRLRCPRTFFQAFFDGRFRRRDRFNRRCFVRIFPLFGPGLRCCYNRFGNLLSGIRSPGGYLSRNPFFFDVSEDDEAYQNCCVLSNLCRAYRRRRPHPSGRFRPRRRAWGLGDPHYSNLDRLNYTFNGCGDYMFLISNDTRFQIQVRFSRAVGAGMGTVISALVIKQEGVDTVQVNHNRNGGNPMLLHINGVEYAHYANLNTTPAVVNDSIIIVREGDNEIQILTEDDHTVVITREPENLVVVVVPETSLFGLTKGLLGNWSNTVEDDFTLPNGTSLGFPLTDEQIHYDFGESWRLAPQDNLFINTTADQNFDCPASYEPIFVSNFTFPNSTIQATANSICGDNVNCIFDIAATLLPSFGQTTMESSDTIQNEVTVAENNAPTFENDNVVFNLTLGEVFEYTIRASDEDGDALKFTTTNIPPGATVQPNGNEITFRWLVNSTQAFNLTFVVEDSKNGSSIFVPQFSVCACRNGTCVKQETSVEQTDLVFTQHEVLSCKCDIGFIGEFCDTVRDFCITQSGTPCHPLSNCTNSPTNYICGDCPTGYSGDGFDCIDNDECVEGTHNCEMLCVNNGGSFVCQCPNGYRLDDNLRNCSDINECATAHDCQQNCRNTEGSFNCSCNDNFKVDPNNPKNCIPRTSCPSDNPCQHVCAIDGTTGSQICSCNRGYMVDPANERRCIDFDECAGVSNLCNQRCINTDGSFTCACLSGYELGVNNFTCQDIDECVISSMIACNRSTGGETCVNLPGSFRCECNNILGFFLIDGVCQVPTNNEVIVVQPEQPPPATQQDRNSSVQLRLPNFQNNQYDRPTDISFRKAIATALNSYCNENERRRTECGLPGSGFEFSESNVFRLSNGTIQDGSDTLVSFYAIYPNGTFAGARVPVPRSVLLSALNDKLNSTVVPSTGVTAIIEDVDECQENTDLCNQICQNTPGSYVCSCRPGYQLTNLFTCADVDECAAQVHNCNGEGEICVNIQRGFVCECNRTLDLGRIDGTCQVLNGTVEPPPVPRNITSVDQVNSAVKLNIPNFQTGQFSRQTDTQLRRAIAAALNNYCNVNESRRAECGLPAGGFEFTETDIHRLPSDPVQDGSGTSVSYYALYPEGIQNGTDIPVSPQVLSRAIAERINDIRSSTGLNSLGLAPVITPSEDDEGIDWPLALGIGLGASLLFLMGLVVGIMCCCKFCAAGGAEKSRYPAQFVYDLYRHRPRRRLNVADLEPSFGTFHSMSGETYSGYDEDGLPVDIQTDYDGLSQQARTVSHMPTVAGSRGSLR